MNIAVVGTGYVGLVSGTCYAENGNEVVCVDIDAARISALNQGKIPIYEPGLEELVRRNSKDKRIRFSTDLADAVRQSMVSFIAVGTPRGADGGAELAAVFNVATEIARTAVGYHVIVIKSTVPVGTNEKVSEVVAGSGRTDIDVCSVPE